ncbi:aldehyde dehydrogenase family protein [Granulicella aggregans]|uniref:aldehyde dehydrogenase family protein n=1 Tax=Granulicella aggregans TaxID=474949 RepID=UPI0021DF5D6F|nr:aldehyde dehydrogenase family protein [Granulicella aggregans]
MPISELKECEAPQDRDMVTAMVERSSQKEWASRAIADRLAVLKRARHILAESMVDLCDAISPELARNVADTRVAEVLPLLEACRFLEREAARTLAPKKLGRKGLPFWLAGISSEVRRAPMGHVLVIAPSNYPLFLPGVQVLQALAAGNSVTWKPGRGGRPVASIFAAAMREAGLPAGLLAVTDESVAAAQQAIAAGVDKVFFTGSAASGRALLKQLAETLTPCVAELSGCDAVFVLPSADLSRVVKALAFGMRLNGSATCMAPRRVILVGTDEQRRKRFIEMLLSALDWIKGVPLSESVQRELHMLLEDARLFGGRVHGKVEAAQQPIVIADATPEMLATRADIFAPVLTIMEARDTPEAIALHEACPYALTASIFGDEDEARGIAAEVTTGTVTINDLIVPTVDPRVPFCGRKGSGFGATRGAEGLLEMTAAKVISVRLGKSTRHFDATTADHEELFDGVIAASHRARWRERIAGFRQIVSAARRFSGK